MLVSPVHRKHHQPAPGCGHLWDQHQDQCRIRQIPAIRILHAQSGHYGEKRHAERLPAQTCCLQEPAHPAWWVQQKGPPELVWGPPESEPVWGLTVPVQTGLFSQFSLTGTFITVLLGQTGSDWFRLGQTSSDLIRLVQISDSVRLIQTGWKCSDLIFSDPDITPSENQKEQEEQKEQGSSVPTLEPLWTFDCKLTRGLTVTSTVLNKKNQVPVARTTTRTNHIHLTVILN